MFAMPIIHIPLNAGSELAFSVQAFFMPGHIVYHIWYPCTPVWSVNAPTAFSGCDRQRERHGYFHFKNLLLCLTTMQKFPQLPLTASERPPTKRVLLPSPLPAILSLTLPPTASTFTGAPSAIYRDLIPRETLLPDASTFPGVKKQPEHLLTNPLFFSWYKRIVNIDVMWLNVINRNVNGICFRLSTVIRMPWCYRLISPDLNILNQSSILLPVATPSGVIAFLYSDLRTNYAIYLNRHNIAFYRSIPRTPWNKKKSKRERILKRKSFKKDIQLSNSPTEKNISKHNSLLYSSIYFLLNQYIYTTKVLFCWMLLDVLDLGISTIQQDKSNKKCEKGGLLDVLDGIQRHFWRSKFA